jgi:hypothetical protein
MRAATTSAALRPWRDGDRSRLLRDARVIRPHTKAVAPFGGKEPLFSPNPFAIAFATTDFPVLIDTCASLTTVSMTREKAAAGARAVRACMADGRRVAADTGSERAGTFGGSRQSSAARRIQSRTQGLRARANGRGVDARSLWPRPCLTPIVSCVCLASRPTAIFAALRLRGLPFQPKPPRRCALGPIAWASTQLRCPSCRPLTLLAKNIALREEPMYEIVGTAVGPAHRPAI